MVSVLKDTLNKKVIPSKIDVISRILFQTTDKKQKLQTAVKSVASEVTEIWGDRRKTSTIRAEKNIIRSMHKMHKKYSVLKKHSIRHTKKEQLKRKHFLIEMGSEFDIEEIKKQKPMMSESESGNESDDEQNERISDTESSNYLSANDSDESCSDASVKPIQKRRLKITPELVSNLDDANVSDYRSTNLILSIAKFLNIDLTETNMSISKSTLNRNRARIRKEISDQIKAKFGENIADSFLVLHWDGKILPKWSSVDGKSDRLAVAVTYGGQSKILGAAELLNGKSVVQFNAIEEIIKDWLVEDFIKAISCDTTSTNTGDKQGICARLRTKYKGMILTLCCRHHTMELLVSKAFEVALNDNSRSPNIEIFERFKLNWNSLDVSKYDSCYVMARVKYAIPSNERNEIVQFIRMQLSFQKQSRKDYVEFLQLALLFLGEKDKFHIRVPGALHRARFMARVIYSLKMLLFRKQFDLSGKYYKT